MQNHNTIQFGVVHVDGGGVPSCRWWVTQVAVNRSADRGRPRAWPCAIVKRKWTTIRSVSGELRLRHRAYALQWISCILFGPGKKRAVILDSWPPANWVASLANAITYRYEPKHWSAGRLDSVDLVICVYFVICHQKTSMQRCRRRTPPRVLRNFEMLIMWRLLSHENKQIVDWIILHKLGCVTHLHLWAVVINGVLLDEWFHWKNWLAVQPKRTNTFEWFILFTRGWTVCVAPSSRNDFSYGTVKT